MKFYGDWRDIPPSEWSWRSFRPVEIACHGDNTIVADHGALDKLQQLRDYLAQPLIVNSGYRSPEYNKAIGGENDSQHKLGKAFDIAIGTHLGQPRLVAAAKRVGFTGIGLYDTFVHVDIGPERSWDYRKGA